MYQLINIDTDTEIKLIMILSSITDEIAEECKHLKPHTQEAIKLAQKEIMAIIENDSNNIEQNRHIIKNIIIIHCLKKHRKICA